MSDAQVSKVGKAPCTSLNKFINVKNSQTNTKKNNTTNKLHVAALHKMASADSSLPLKLTIFSSSV